MTMYRFEVNVPNPDSKPSDVALRLEVADPKLFAAIQGGERRKRLQIEHTGIDLDPCARGGAEKLKLRLEPHSAATVYVTVETGGPVPGVAGVNLIDRRGSRDVGGVLVVCADPPLQEAAGGPVAARNPCPAVLARPMYAVALGEDPKRAPHLALVAGNVTAFDLVAPIKNPTKSKLADAAVYIEHTGSSGAAFAPGMWNIGELATGDVFYATWRVELSAGSITPIEPVVVASSARADPVRLSGSLPVKDRREGPKSRKG